MFRRIKSIYKNRAGFTLIETLIAITIIALMGSGIFTTIYQIFNLSHKDNSRLMAVKQVEYIVDTISRDAASAQDATSSFGISGGIGFVQFNWVSWDNTPKQVKYMIPNNNKNLQNNQLRRISNFGLPNAVVTRYLDFDWFHLYDPANPDPGLPTFCDFDSNAGKLTVKISSTIGTATETRTFQISPAASSMRK
jgi:prepilin-type N-terminal cleavage/methylation domain-containing protein